MKRKKPELVTPSPTEHPEGICEGCLNVNDKVRKPVKTATDGVNLCQAHWAEFQKESFKLFKHDVASFYLH